MLGRAQITFRRGESGGGVLREALTIRAGARRHRYVLLVHGYNTAQRGAKDSYDRFTGRVARLARWFGRQVIYVYWPGDRRLKPWSTASYPLAIGKAQAVAPGFGRYLNALRAPSRGPCDIVLIGHSLGCRLILETLLALGGPLVQARSLTLILLAAAVPVSLVKAGGRLHSAIARAQRASIFYSPADETLARWFRLGQMVAREGGFWPEAVGHRGRPKPGLWENSRHMNGYEHSDYWKGQEAACQIARMLGATVACPKAPRLIVGRRSTISRPDPPARVAPAARSLAAAWDWT